MNEASEELLIDLHFLLFLNSADVSIIDNWLNIIANLNLKDKSKSH